MMNKVSKKEYEDVCRHRRIDYQMFPEYTLIFNMYKQLVALHLVRENQYWVDGTFYHDHVLDNPECRLTRR
jgi:hypothetical protein